MNASGEGERRYCFGRSDASAWLSGSKVSVRARTSRAGYASRGFVARLGDNDPDFGSDPRRRASCIAPELAHDVAVASAMEMEGDSSGALGLTFVRDGSRGAFRRWRPNRNVGSTRSRPRWEAIGGFGRREQTGGVEGTPLEGHRVR